MSDPQRQRKLWYIIGGVLIVGFLGFGGNAFRQSLTPYVSFAEAKTGATKVQVAGGLVPDSPRYLDETSQLRFVLVDEQGENLTVLYGGVVPGNFEEATEIVVVGRFEDGVFAAEKLLTKCPSKYQGLDTPGQP